MDPSIELTMRLFWGLSASDSDSTFQSTLINKLSDVNCVGLSSSYLTFENGKYIPVDEEKCLSLKSCNWNSLLGEEECINGLGGRNFCGVCLGPSCTYLSRPKSCFTIQEASNPESCEKLGGFYDFSMDPYSCIFRNITIIDQCLPRSICPRYSRNSRVTMSCDKPVCFLKDVDYQKYSAMMQDYDCATFSTRKELPKRWDQTLAGGNGLCTIVLPSPDEQLCVASNGTWFGGRSWNYDIHSTEETCQGICTVGDYLYLGSTKNECDAIESCGMSVPRCLSQIGLDLCYSDVSLCECLKLGAAYDKKIMKCVHKLNETECTRNGYTYQSCESLSNEKCYECAVNPGSASCPVLQSFLKCAVTRNITPPQSYCVTPESGQCLDNVLYNSDPSCGRSVSFAYEDASNTDCFGSCVRDFSIGTNGKPFCSALDGLRYSPLGCINSTVYTRDDCEVLDYHKWIHKSLSEQDCLVTKGQGCDLFDSQTILNPMYSG